MGKRKKVQNEISYNLSLRETLDKIKEIFKLKELKLLILLDEEVPDFVPQNANYKLMHSIKICAKFIGLNESNNPFKTREQNIGLDVFREYDGKYFAKNKYLYSFPKYLNNEELKQLIDTKITDYFHNIAYILYQMTNQSYRQTGCVGYELPSDLNINSMHTVTKVYYINDNSLDGLNALFISVDSNLKFKDLLMNNNGEIMKNFMFNKNKLIIIIE